MVSIFSLDLNSPLPKRLMRPSFIKAQVYVELPLSQLIILSALIKHNFLCALQKCTKSIRSKVSIRFMEQKYNVPRETKINFVQYV